MANSKNPSRKIIPHLKHLLYSLVMTGSTLSQASKWQKQRSIDKKMNNAIEEYQAQKDL